MKIYQYDVRKGNTIETAVVVPFSSESRVEEIAINHLEGADEVIVTVWKYGKQVETLSFLPKVEEVAVEEVIAEEVAVEEVVVEEVTVEDIKTFKNNSHLFEWYCKPRFGTVSCQLVEGSRPVKKKIFKDEIGQYIKIGKEKIYYTE